MECLCGEVRWIVVLDVSYTIASHCFCRGYARSLYVSITKSSNDWCWSRLHFSTFEVQPEHAVDTI